MSHCLYRHYARNGELLYVGISRNGVGRQNQHLKNAEWWAEIGHIAIGERFATRKAAEEAEQWAIRRERPKYNVVHTKPPPLPRMRLFLPRRPRRMFKP